MRVTALVQSERCTPAAPGHPGASLRLPERWVAPLAARQPAWCPLWDLHGQHRQLTRPWVIEVRWRRCYRMCLPQQAVLPGRMGPAAVWPLKHCRCCWRAPLPAVLPCASCALRAAPRNRAPRRWTLPALRHRTSGPGWRPLGACCGLLAALLPDRAAAWQLRQRLVPEANKSTLKWSPVAEKGKLFLSRKNGRITPPPPPPPPGAAGMDARFGVDKLSSRDPMARNSLLSAGEGVPAPGRTERQRPSASSGTTAAA